MIVLEGYLDVPADRIEAVLAALPEHIELTKAEPGCISFSVEVSPALPTRLIVSETFRDQSAFDVHQARSRASAWFKVTEGMPRHYKIETRSDPTQ